jgi:hypothetical protein
VKNRRAGPKIFVYTRVSNLGEKQISWAFFDLYLDFLSVKVIFFLIWVGNPVFTVPVLFNENYQQMSETAKRHFFKISK